MQLRSAALAGYRNMLRTIHQVFKGDGYAIKQTTAQLRTQVVANRAVSDASEIERMVADMRDASDFLKTYIAQGKLNDRGNFEVTVKRTQVEDDKEHIEVDPLVAPKKRS